VQALVRTVTAESDAIAELEAAVAARLGARSIRQGSDGAPQWPGRRLIKQALRLERWGAGDDTLVGFGL
jgi:hypothetical protein